MGLSRRAYAALRGVHESAVRKAIAVHRMTAEAAGCRPACSRGKSALAILRA